MIRHIYPLSTLIIRWRRKFCQETHSDTGVEERTTSVSVGASRRSKLGGFNINLSRLALVQMYAVSDNYRYLMPSFLDKIDRLVLWMEVRSRLVQTLCQWQIKPKCTANP